MADRGVLFSGPMVRALLDGTKTQTRRGIVMPSRRGHSEFGRSDTVGYDWHFRDSSMRWHDVKHERMLELLQHRAGDRLYVREHWRTVGAAGMLDGVAPRDLEPQAVWYIADGAAPENEFAGRFRQGMHMPRWASRLTLTVTDVRVELLQNISEDDAFAEGIETDVGDMAPAARHYGEADAWFVGWSMGIAAPSISVEADEVCRRSYATLWDKINGSGAWEANPWVAAYTFTVHQGNIDAPA